jgi:outer membrane protein, heavy metal efflux system
MGFHGCAADSTVIGIKSICLCLLLPVCGLGQSPLTALSAGDAVERALRQHPILTADRARVQVAEGRRQQLSLRPNPRLYLQNENARVGGGSSPFRFSQETDTFAYASQVFESAGKRDRRVELATEILRGRQLEVDDRRARIALNVLNAYWAAAGAQRIRDVLKNNLAILEQAVEYHRHRVREGAAAEVDLIRINLEKEQVSVQFENARQESRRLRLQLFREMGEPDQAGVALTGDLEAIDPVPAPSIDEALRRRPDLRLAQQSIEQAKASTRLEQANARPDPEVLFGYKRTVGFNTVIAGLQLSLPFRNRNQGSIASSLAEQRAAEFDLQSAVLAARSDILSAQSEVEQKRQLLAGTFPRIRAEAQDIARIARAVQREGAGDLLRLLDAERANLQTELLYVQTLIEYRLALTNLQAVTGMLP